MAKAKKSTGPKKTFKKSSKSTNFKMIQLIFVVVGLFVMVSIILTVLRKANEAKEVNVQKTQEINGSVPGTGFKAWDLMSYGNGLALSDQSLNRILLLDLQGNKIAEISGKNAGLPEFKEPSCLTKDPTGNLFVMDTWNGLIRGYDPKGKAILKLDLNGKGYYGPRGLAWDKNSFLIADTGSHRLAKITLDGSLEGAWGNRGSGKIQFNNPYQVVGDGQGNAFVVDRDNDRIQVLDGQGKFVREIALGAQPTAEAIDLAKKIIYISSLDGRFVKAFSLEGKYVGQVVEAGQKGQSIPDVNALCVLPTGDLALLQGGNRILIEHILPPPTN